MASFSKTFDFNLRRDHQKNFLWASRLWVGSHKEPILGYVPKNDEKKNSGGKGLKRKGGYNIGLLLGVWHEYIKLSCPNVPIFLTSDTIDILCWVEQHEKIFIYIFFSWRCLDKLSIKSQAKIDAFGEEIFFCHNPTN